MEYLRVARIVKPIGLHGEVKIFSTTSFPNIRYKKGNKLYLLKDNEYLELTVKEHHIKDAKFDSLIFNEFSTFEEVESLSNLDLFAIKDDSILNKNEFYFDDLKGLKIFDKSQKYLGKVQDIEEFPAQITLKVLEENGKIAYIPFNDFFCTEVNLKEQYIIINVIEGLL